MACTRKRYKIKQGPRKGKTITQCRCNGKLAKSYRCKR